MDKVFSVEGMHCQHCVAAVKKALAKVPGVGYVDVDLAEKTVKVTFDPASAGEELMKKAIEGAGYKVLA